MPFPFWQKPETTVETLSLQTNLSPKQRRQCRLPMSEHTVKLEGPPLLTRPCTNCKNYKVKIFLSPIMLSYITDTGLIVIGRKAYQIQGTQCSRQTGTCKLKERLQVCLFKICQLNVNSEYLRYSNFKYT